MSTDTAVRPTPAQALALEIVDALSAVVPRGWQRVELRIGRGTQGRARVTEMTTRVAVEPPPAKPSLGLEAGSLQGAVNEALSDLFVLLGCVDPVPSDVTVERAAPDGFALRIGDAHTIAIDRSLADYLLFTDALFAALDVVQSDFQPRQTALSTEIAGHDDWEYDAATTTLQLKRGVLPWRALVAVPVGSLAFESESWLWGWANDALPAAATAAVASVRDASRSEHRMSVLRRAELPCSEEFAVRIAAIAALRMGARGLYGAPFGTGVMFLAVMAGERAS